MTGPMGVSGMDRNGIITKFMNGLPATVRGGFGKCR